MREANTSLLCRNFFFHYSLKSYASIFKNTDCAGHLLYVWKLASGASGAMRMERAILFLEGRGDPFQFSDRNSKRR